MCGYRWVSMETKRSMTCLNTNYFILTWLPSSNTNSISLFFYKLHTEKVVKILKVDFRDQKLLFWKFEDRLFLVKRFQIDLLIHIFDKHILKIFEITPITIVVRVVLLDYSFYLSADYAFLLSYYYYISSDFWVVAYIPHIYI